MKNFKGKIIGLLNCWRPFLPTFLGLKKVGELPKGVNGNEKGIALIFTLAFLSLLLIVALSFASESVLEQKIAHYSSMGSSANMMAQSALNRALAALRLSHMDLQYDENIYKIYSKGLAPGVTFTDTDSALSDSMDSALAYDVDGFDLLGTLDSTTNIKWQYVTNGLTGNDVRILGRVVYVAIPLNGRLDPSAMVDSPVNEAATTQLRPGVSPVEMYLGAVDTPGAATNDASVMTTTVVRNLNMKNVLRDSYGKLTADTRWMNDWGNFFSQLGVADTSVSAESMRQWFTLSDSRTPEAMWLQDDITNGVVDSPEMYHRFQLNRTDWNSLTVAGMCDSSITDANGNLTTYLKQSSGQVSTYNTGCIPWLANFGKGSDGSEIGGVSGTFSSIKDRRRQIIANLIDYCDSDSIPTSGVTVGTVDSGLSPSSWATVDPNYTGNEKTPYINELGLLLHINVKFDNETPAGVNVKRMTRINVYGSFYGELIDIFSSSGFTKNAKMTVYYTASLANEYTHSDGESTAGIIASPSINTGSVLLDFSTAADWGSSPPNSLGYISSDYTDYISFSDFDDIIHVGAYTTTIKTTLKINITKIVLEYLGANVDIVLSGYGEQTVVKQYSISNGEAGTDNYYYKIFSFQAKDPRQNLFLRNTTTNNDWYYGIADTTVSNGYGWPPDYADSSSPGSFGSSNYHLTNRTESAPSSGSDPESGTDPANGNISTAYIRNGPMQSPWELGAIHRGAKWETINLKAYKESVATSIKAGAGTYSDGDANILDQIKMTSDTATYGKVNLYNANKDVLRALFSYIYIHGGYDNPGATGSDVITKAAIADLDTDLSGNVITAVSTPASFKTRAALADVTQLTSGLNSTIAAATTDAKKEELIGKIINLTEAYPANTYLIIATAQTIKDIGGGVAIRKVDSTGAAIPPDGTDNKVQYGVFDVGTSGTAETVYFDEITGECKIMAIVKQMSNGEWKILRYKVLSE